MENNTKPCHYWTQGYWCPYGSKCSYNHPGQKACSFYEKGNCKYGNKCNFIHQSTKPPEPLEQRKLNDKTPRPARPARPAPAVQSYMPSKPGPIPMDQLTTDTLKQLHSSESEYLRKRFQAMDCPLAGFGQTTDAGQNVWYTIPFCSSDPDWAFDVRWILLLVHLPESYPNDVCRIAVDPERNLEIMETLRLHLNKTIRRWIEDRFKKNTNNGCCEAVMRPFFRWLDANLETSFLQGLTNYKRDLQFEAQGISTVRYNDLKLEREWLPQSSSAPSPPPSPLPPPPPETNTQLADLADGLSDCHLDKNRSSTSVSGHSTSKTSANCDFTLEFRSLSMEPETLSFRAKSASLVVQCERCKNRLEVKKCRHGGLVRFSCDRCRWDGSVRLSAAICHAHSAVFGYVDVDGCRLVDVNLQNCSLAVSCPNVDCSSETIVSGWQVGTLKAIWCQWCYSKSRLQVEAVRVIRRAGRSGQEPTNRTDERTSSKKSAGRQRGTNADLLIKEGQPLPSHGTCKHYKKSFRWFRFPCCGLCFACDVCHLESRLATDKDSSCLVNPVLANRVICGFCAHEQGASAGELCGRCKKSMAQSVAGKSHWEGGTGCRDPVKMSRRDCRKYASLNKTRSKPKAQKKT